MSFASLVPPAPSHATKPHSQGTAAQLLAWAAGSMSRAQIAVQLLRELLHLQKSPLKNHNKHLTGFFEHYG